MTFREKLESLPQSTFAGETVSLRPIREEQEYVNPAGFSIGRAYLNPENNYPCVILNSQGQRVGFILLAVWLGAGDGYTWSYYVDFRQQGKGYGKAGGRKGEPESPKALPFPGLCASG